jgi:hypothetical protein
MTNTLSLLVDVSSIATDPELPHLLSFGGVGDLSIEQHITLIERPGQGSEAILGAAGNSHVSLAPLNQFKRFASDIAARPGCQVSSEVVQRALAYSFLADRLKVDAVVSSARPAFGPGDEGLLGKAALVTPGEALAMIGANVRQREVVPLGGRPLLVQQRSEVYPLTAMVIIPNGQDWWSACVHTARPEQSDLLGHAQAVFTRIGKALRARDSVHEALRVGAGRSAILDTLDHFDAVLTSSVGALDALARVAHEIFGLSLDVRRTAWQNDEWREALRLIAPNVATAVEPSTRLGSALRVLTNTRNSIHSIPLDEYLSVEREAHVSRVEHRVMMSEDLSRRLQMAGAGLGRLDQYGIFIEDHGTSFLNVAQLTEQLLSWTIELIGELLRAMLSCSQLARGTPLDFSPVELFERELCAKLARVGEYPIRRGRQGLPAAPSLHRTVMASIHQPLSGA